MYPGYCIQSQVAQVQMHCALVIMLCDLKSVPLSGPCLSNGERAGPPATGCY